MPDDPVRGDPQPQRREERAEDGTLLAEWFVVNDAQGNEVRHGEFIAFHPNGQRREHGFYDHGKRVGVWFGWTEDGRRLFDQRADAEPDERAAVAEPAPEDWNVPVVPEPAKREGDKLGLAVEAVVVLCLGWLPFMASAVVSPGLFGDPTEGEVIVNEWAAVLTEIVAGAYSVGVIVPLLWIMYRSGSAWASFGIVRPKLIRDALGGALLGAFFIAGSLLYEHLTGEFVVYSDLVVPERALGWATVAVALLLNSLAEEFVWRGFLQRRATQLTGSLAIAVILCSLLFASYHIYHGPVALFDVALFGLVFGIWTHKARSIWPAVVAHTAYNLYVWIYAALEYAPGA